MSFFDHVQRASFNGTEFPVTKIRVHLSQRVHVHEYPHQDGGKTEIMGRRLYDITVDTVFDENIKLYSLNYPFALTALRRQAERAIIGPLVLPNLGTVNALMLDFTQEWTAMVRSGETAQFQFQEQMSDDELNVFVALDSMAFASSQLDNKMALILAIKADLAAEDALRVGSLWGPLSDAVGKLQVGLGKADLYANVIEQRVESIVEMIRIVDNGIQHPVGWRVLSALKDLAQAVRSVTITLAGQTPIKLGSFASFTTPRKMAISDVSLRLFGDSKHGVELLQINPIEDAFNIPAGTVLRYLAAA